MDSTSAPQPDHDTRDSFDYADYKPTTRQTFCVGISPISTISAALDDVWDPEQLAKRLVTNIYEKEILGARARYPDEENSSNGVLALPNGMQSQNKASAIHLEARMEFDVASTTSSQDLYLPVLQPRQLYVV